MPCKNCCRSACCGPKLRAKLTKLAYETDSQGCFLEPSDRVRRMARLALANCNCVPEKPGQPAAKLPEEGPGAEDSAPPAAEPAPAPVASVLKNSESMPFTTGLSASPIGSGLATTWQPSFPPLAGQSATATPVSYEQALVAYAKEAGTSNATPARVPPGPLAAGGSLNPATYQAIQPPRALITRPPRVAIQRLPPCDCK
jgi:hypothetical protein